MGGLGVLDGDVGGGAVGLGGEGDIVTLGAAADYVQGAGAELGAIAEELVDEVGVVAVGGGGWRGGSGRGGLGDGAIDGAEQCGSVDGEYPVVIETESGGALGVGFLVGFDDEVEGGFGGEGAEGVEGGLRVGLDGLEGADHGGDGAAREFAEGVEVVIDEGDGGGGGALEGGGERAIGDDDEAWRFDAGGQTHLVWSVGAWSESAKSMASSSSVSSGSARSGGCSTGAGVAGGGCMG